MTVGKGVFTLTAPNRHRRRSRGLARRAAACRATSRPRRDSISPVRFSARRTSGNRIVFQRAPARDTSLGPEGYRLVVKPGVVTITSSRAGRRVLRDADRFASSAARDLPRRAGRRRRRGRFPPSPIVDRPRFSWRGMHLDVSRHFMPKEFVKKYIDLLALHKMNTLHWHLTDDQGWRIEIKKYPRLTEVGAWRSQTLVGHSPGRDTTHNVYDKKPHGGFYTQDDVREIVAYARERFVRVVPEIEMPGHSQAAIAAYPSLGNFGDTVRVWDQWGVTPHILNPSRHDHRVHAGRAHRGDGALSRRVHSRRRRRSDQARVEGEPASAGEDPRAWNRARRFANPRDFRAENELQSWFITQMDKFLTSHGRRLIGWDEILEGGLAPNAA